MRIDCEQPNPILEASESLVEHNSELDPIQRHDLDSSKPRRSPTKSIIRRLRNRQFRVALHVVYLPIATILAAPSGITKGAVLLE